MMKILLFWAVIGCLLVNDSDAAQKSPNPINLSQFWQLVDQGSATNGLDWERVATSQNGNYQTAVVKAYGLVTGGNIYLSQDYGKSWKPLTNNFNLGWSGVALSSNGRYQTAVAEGDCIYVSDNFGKSFVKRTNTLGNWTAVGMSSNGKYQTAVANSYNITNNFSTGLYQSSDFGKTWKPSAFSYNSWLGVSLSSDGRIQTAVSFAIDGTEDPDGREGRVYNSYDFGNSWITNTTLPPNYYTSSAMSGDGRIQVVGAQNCNLAPATPGRIYISYDYGQHYAVALGGPVANWLFFSISNDGRYMLGATYQQTDTNGSIVPDTGAMYSSSDYGVTWTPTDAPLNTWTSVQLAADGGIAAATAWTNGIYIKAKTGLAQP